MKHFLAILAAVFVLSFSGHAQEKMIRHTVVKGETITQIAQKYEIKVSDIYRLNPDAQNGLKPDMILLIQRIISKNNKPEKNTIPKIHTIAPKETIYGLAKMYNVSEEALRKANPQIAKDGLKVGTIINIPEKEKENIKEPKKDGKTATIFHQVTAKETKYSIAKEYGITIAQLEADNPEIKTGLQIGFRLKIIPGNNKEQVPQVAVQENEAAITKPEPKKPEFLEYQIKPKETFYSLEKKFGMSQEELVRFNPELSEGVKEGMILKYPANTLIVENTEKELIGLSKTIKNQDKKQLVLLLPFNISKIEGDTLNSTASRLKTDKFLNMTLDFYSGALMAIDSARTLNLNIDVQILDSQETKNSSAITTLIREYKLDKADAVIGPFYQANVEKTAELLNKFHVPVISPLSKDTGKLYPNLLQSMPSTDMVKNSIIDYLRSKNGNITALIDPKKLSTKQFLSRNKDIKSISLNEKGLVTADSVAKKMVKGKINYVILDSERTGMILNTLNVLVALMADYEIQLVILEKNDTLDFEEIPLAKLARLKMLYPSLTRDNETPEALIFEKDYKEKNKIFPNYYATRGFDITFDTMLRLSQEKDFMETINTIATEQVDNRFEYEKKVSGGNTNKGFYILYYETDLSVKEAN